LDFFSPGTPVEPKSFITLHANSVNPNHGGKKSGNAAPKLPPCCQEAGLLSCVPASIEPEALGHGSIALSPNLVLDYVGHVGADGNSFQYRRGGAGGAEATITCHKAKKGGCNGEARDAEGNAFVLEFCGPQGHVWKQPNMKLFSDHGKKKVRSAAA
jgi:hypothetical protein